MANHQYGSTTFEQKAMPQAPAEDTEDVFSGGTSARAAPTTQARTTPQRRYPTLGESHAVGEVAGDATVRTESDTTTEAAVSHEEVGSAEGTESGEEYIEASASQLSAAAAESGEESAVSDLRSIEGFEAPEGAQEGEEGAAPVQPPLRDAGAAVEGGQEEFLPFLAALAPTLISTIGPAVAKGVMSKLKPKTAKRVLSIANKAKAVLPTIAKAGAPAGQSNLLALIAKLLQQMQAKPAGESGMEIDEAFVVEAARAMEVIIGTDDRVRITTTSEIPWRRLCALRIHFPSGATYRGTGFLIGARAVATAGHCVYLHNQGGWARRVEVIPGCNGSSRPYGQAESATLRSVAGWVTGRKPESDYGCIVLPSGAFGGRNLGSFGFAAFQAPTLLAQPAVLGGYPGDKTFAELWGMARLVKAVAAKTLVYDIDTMGGQSGAPVYIKRNGQRYVVGIHNYGAGTGNSATRVTQPVYQRLLGWSKL